MLSTEYFLQLQYEEATALAGRNIQQLGMENLSMRENIDTTAFR